MNDTESQDNSASSSSWQRRLVGHINRTRIRHHERWYDDPAVSARINQDGTSYRLYSPAVLRAMLGESEGATLNAHEFLNAFAALHDLSFLEISRQIGCSKTLISHMCNGSQLPGKARLPALQKIMDSYDSEYYPRFKNLIIRNRLERAQMDSHPTMEIEELPPSYWRIALEVCNGRNPEISPLWSSLLKVPRTKGQYLRAARYLANLPQMTADARVGVNDGIILEVEYDYILAHPNIYQRFADIYLTIPDVIPHFEQSVFGNLPEGSLPNPHLKNEGQIFSKNRQSGPSGRIAI